MVSRALVRPPPGVRPETLLLTRASDGEHIALIDRVSESSESSNPVLSDENVRNIGELMIELEASFPIDEEVPEGRRVLLDSEWKVLSDGTLVIKQVRPFLH